MDFLEKIENAISGGVGVAFRFLGSQSPLRTSIGVCLGVVLMGLFDILIVILSTFSPSVSLLALLEIDSIWFIALGILILYFPVLVKYVNPKREEILDENLDKVFAALRKTFRDGNVDPITQRRFYIQIAQSVVDKLNLKPEIQEEIRLENQLAQEPKEDG